MQNAKRSSRRRPLLKTTFGRSVFAVFMLSLPLAAATPDGYVVRVDSPTVYLDWGKTAGVQAGDTFDVFRAGEPLRHPVTGEVLGQSEQRLGQGVIETLQDKFSIGRILEQRSPWQVGDRTRFNAPKPNVVAPVTPVAGGAPVSAAAPVPKEFWRSEPMKGEPIGIAAGDIEGCGSADLVVALADRLEVYRWNGQKLESIATYKDRSSGDWIAVDVAKAEGDRTRIFATAFMDGLSRARVAVLEWSSGTLKEVGHFDGFARAFPRLDGTLPLYAQELGMSRDLRIRAPESVKWNGKKFKTEGPVKLSRAPYDNQLFGYAWGDWDKDGTEDFAFLQNGEHLRVFFKEAQWSADENYGGTKADFAFNTRNEELATLFPRLASVTSTDGKALLLVPHNIPDLGVRFQRLKLFRQGELLGLAWNGLQMDPLWKLPVKGYLADFAVASLAESSRSEVWLVAGAPGGKTVILGYALP